MEAAEFIKELFANKLISYTQRKLFMETLNKMDKEEVKRDAIKVLKNIICFLEKDDYESIEEHISYSPGGDDMGIDNYFIDFSKDGSGMDISDVIKALKATEDEEDK